MGIEPTYPAWKAGVLPLNYTRISVGVTGFEPATSWSQTRRSSQAEPHPESIVFHYTFKTSYKVQEFQTANNLTKVVISIPLCFISMILLRKTPSVSSAISADKSAPCHFLHPAVFLRFGQALDRLVTVSSMCCHTSTSALSTL